MAIRVWSEVKTITHIQGGVRIAAVGNLIETEAKKRGYKVIKNYGGHRISRPLHEEPQLGNKGGFMAQHEHTIVVTDATPVIMTGMNGIWN